MKSSGKLGKNGQVGTRVTETVKSFDYLPPTAQRLSPDTRTTGTVKSCNILYNYVDIKLDGATIDLAGGVEIMRMYIDLRWFNK